MIWQGRTPPLKEWMQCTIKEMRDDGKLHEPVGQEKKEFLDDLEERYYFLVRINWRLTLVTIINIYQLSTRFKELERNNA